MNTDLQKWNTNAAMRDIYDVGERLQVFPILLGEVARQIYDHPDHMFDISVDKIEWGIMQSQMTAEVKSLFNTWNFTPNEKGYEYTYEGGFLEGEDVYGLLTKKDGTEIQISNRDN